MAPKIQHHFAYRCCQEIETIMRPALKKHGMTIFNYYKIYDNKKALRLSTHREWTAHYLKQNYININTVPPHYLKNPVNYFIWLVEDCPKILLDAAVNFDIANGISIARKVDNGMEFFCFGTKASNHSIVNFYLNNLDLLTRYGEQFKEYADQIISHAEKKQLILQPTRVTNDKNTSFLSTHQQSFDFKLSQRQLDCSLLLLQGRQYKKLLMSLIYRVER